MNLPNSFGNFKIVRLHDVTASTGQNCFHRGVASSGGATSLAFRAGGGAPRCFWAVGFFFWRGLAGRTLGRVVK